MSKPANSKKLNFFQKQIRSMKKRVSELHCWIRARMVLPSMRTKKGDKPLEIEVITMMYNEATLAPLFVRHYAPWVDKFTVFYSNSLDNTRQALETAAAECGVKSLNVLPFEFPNGFDDLLKIECINQAVRQSTADFVICVDADEFVYPWPFDKADPRKILAEERENVVRCSMFQVYRHSTETDINTQKPPLMQRRHGIPDHDDRGREKWHDKPCILRPDSGTQLHVGCHFVTMRYPESRTVWRGVHWGKADDFCLERYVRDRRDRLSENNRQNNYGIENFDITRERLQAFLIAHRNDPQLF